MSTNENKNYKVRKSYVYQTLVWKGLFVVKQLIQDFKQARNATVIHKKEN